MFGDRYGWIEHGGNVGDRSGFLASDASKATCTALLLRGAKALLSHIETRLCQAHMCPEPVQRGFEARHTPAIESPRCGDETLYARNRIGPLSTSCDEPL